MPREHLIGVISDTHGLLRPEAVAALKGVEMILHAGDIGPAEVLAALREIAPTVAVRGNCDRAPWTEQLRPFECVEVGGRLLYFLHNIEELDLNPAAAGIGAVIFGHSHAPHIERHDGVLYFNPGSAGPRRFKLPVALGILRIGETIEAEVIELTPKASGKGMT